MRRARRGTPGTVPARAPLYTRACGAEPAQIPGKPPDTPAPPQAPGTPAPALPSLWTQAERTRLGQGPTQHAGERGAAPSRASDMDLWGKAVKNTRFQPPGLAEGQRHRHPAGKRGRGGGGIPPLRGGSTKSCGEGEGGGGGKRGRGRTRGRSGHSQNSAM